MMALISLTTVTLRSIFLFPAFWYHSIRSYRACIRSTGIVATKLDGLRLTYSTMTLWQDRQSMQKFVSHPHHIRAMKWSRGRIRGETYHYEGDALPAWPDAYALLAQHGKAV